MKFAVSTSTWSKVAMTMLWMLSSLVVSAAGDLIISEIAPRGSAGVCQGNDWVELQNTDVSSSVDLFADGYILHDDKGFLDPDAFYFPEGTLLAPGAYMLLCTKFTAAMVEDAGITLSPQFGIGRSDTITLATYTSSAASTSSSRAMDTYAIVSSVGPLPSIDVINGFDVSYAYATTTGLYNYTSDPTPGSENIITPAATPEAQIVALKEQLSAQNALGTDFFNMDDRGYPVEDGMDPILDFRLTMLEDDYEYLTKNASFEIHRPFQSGIVTTRDAPNEVLWTLSSPGRIRPKGQSTLYIPLCLGASSFPFQLDLAHTNSSQTLFGAERVYLRTHMGDFSYVRDWSYYRMAARFGLPHLRARKVRFFINDQMHGFYTLLEAPDQDYVFHRNFPQYDPTNYALYKVKTLGLGCGQYSDEQLAKAEERMVSSTEATPPYSFQRGEHKPVVPELGPMAMMDCFWSFFGTIFQSEDDVVLAYLRYDKSCSAMLLEEGLIDRDLGPSGWDGSMKEFIDSGAFASSIDSTRIVASTTPSFDPAEFVDEDHALKMIAFYAVTLNTDSPLGQGNNYYWAQPGEEANGWKMFPYDFNAASTIVCGVTCDGHAVHWSIVQPTCSEFAKNPLVGTILSDPKRHEKYLQYVSEFVDTVYANETFVQEIQDLLEVQDADVRVDGFSAGGMFYDFELSPDAADWQEHGSNFPLLPTMKARATDVREQLAAITNGTYPRGPHDVGFNGDYEPWETCPDWRLTEAPGSACPENCRYEGCHMPGWIIPSSCDDATGTCVHANTDPQCEGVADFDRYDGMEEGPGVMCFNVNGFATKMSSCPVFNDTEAFINGTETSSANHGFRLTLALLVSVSAAVFWF